MSIEIPCESTPERSVSTITSAVVRTSPASIPHAVRIDAICCRTRSAGTFISGGLPFGGRKFYRQRSLARDPGGLRVALHVLQCDAAPNRQHPARNLLRNLQWRRGSPEAATVRPCSSPTMCASAPGGDIRRLLGVPHGRAVCDLSVLGGG